MAYKIQTPGNRPK